MNGYKLVYTTRRPRPSSRARRAAPMSAIRGHDGGEQRRSHQFNLGQSGVQGGHRCRHANPGGERRKLFGRSAEGRDPRAKDPKTPVKLVIKNQDRFREVTLNYSGGPRYPRLEKVGTANRPRSSADGTLSPDRTDIYRQDMAGCAIAPAIVFHGNSSGIQARKTVSMRIDLIPVGKSPPDDINVVIEVPTGGEPVKYEFDKARAPSSSIASCTRRCATRPITASCRTR